MTTATAMIEEKKAGRPAGEKRQALSQWVSVRGRFTMGQLVRELNWSMRDANNTIRRAVERQELLVADHVPQHGCKRRVAVYTRAESNPSHSLSAAVANWLK